MPKITEIIPNDMPDWAIEAMDNGQLFNVTFDKIKEKDQLLLESVALIRQHVAKEAAVKELMSKWMTFHEDLMKMPLIGAKGGARVFAQCADELQSIFADDTDGGVS